MTSEVYPKESAHRLVVDLVVDVHETPVHIRQRLDLVLQVLRQVVRSPERHLRRKDNIDFHDVVRAGVVYPARIDRDDLGREGQGLSRQVSDALVLKGRDSAYFVRDQVLELHGRGDTCKMGELLCEKSARGRDDRLLAELTVDRACPDNNDAQSKDGSAHGVDLRINSAARMITPRSESNG